MSHINEYPADQYPYRIRNWRKYQHYRFRNPPWIKLHTEILSSEDWVVLDDASKLLAVVIMLIAVKHDGHIPASISPAYLKRVAYLDKLPNIKPLITCRFLEKTLADASNVEHLRTNADTETETETETELEIYKEEIEREIQQKGSGQPRKEDWFEEFWDLYPRKIGKQDARKSLDRLQRCGTVARETFMAGVHRYVDYASTRDIKYVKHPATWINKGCWDDVFAPAEYINGDTCRERSLKEKTADALQRIGSDNVREIIGFGLPKLSHS